MSRGYTKINKIIFSDVFSLDFLKAQDLESLHEFANFFGFPIKEDVIVFKAETHFESYSSFSMAEALAFAKEIETALSNNVLNNDDIFYNTYNGILCRRTVCKSREELENAIFTKGQAIRAEAEAKRLVEAKKRQERQAADAIKYKRIRELSKHSTYVDENGNKFKLIPID